MLKPSWCQAQAEVCGESRKTRQNSHLTVASRRIRGDVTYAGRRLSSSAATRSPTRAATRARRVVPAGRDGGLLAVDTGGADAWDRYPSSTKAFSSTPTTSTIPSKNVQNMSSRKVPKMA